MEKEIKLELENLISFVYNTGWRDGRNNRKFKSVDLLIGLYEAKYGTTEVGK